MFIRSISHFEPTDSHAKARQTDVDAGMETDQLQEITEVNAAETALFQRIDHATVAFNLLLPIVKSGMYQNVLVQNVAIFDELQINPSETDLWLGALAYAAKSLQLSGFSSTDEKPGNSMRDTRAKRHYTQAFAYYTADILEYVATDYLKNEDRYGAIFTDFLDEIELEAVANFLANDPNHRRHLALIIDDLSVKGQSDQTSGPGKKDDVVSNLIKKAVNNYRHHGNRVNGVPKNTARLSQSRPGSLGKMAYRAFAASGIVASLLTTNPLQEVRSVSGDMRHEQLARAAKFEILSALDTLDTDKLVEVPAALISPNAMRDSLVKLNMTPNILANAFVYRISPSQNGALPDDVYIPDGHTLLGILLVKNDQGAITGYDIITKRLKTQGEPYMLSIYPVQANLSLTPDFSRLDAVFDKLPDWAIKSLVDYRRVLLNYELYQKMQSGELEVSLDDPEWQGVQTQDIAVTISKLSALVTEMVEKNASTTNLHKVDFDMLADVLGLKSKNLSTHNLAVWKDTPDGDERLVVSTVTTQGSSLSTTALPNGIIIVR